MKVSIITMMAMALISISSLTFANTQDPAVNVRQEIQKNRIIQGVKSGELNQHETRRLVKQQRNIHRLEKAYKSDGHLTKRERLNLHNLQNRSSKTIWRKKHNAQRR